MTDNPTFQRVRRAFRMLTAALLAVRVGLALTYLRTAAMQTVAPVGDHFFPVLLRQPALLLMAFFVPVVGEVLVLRRGTRLDLKRASVVEAGGAALLLLHQATYFYATWVVFFWAGVFLVWMAWSAADSEERAGATGPFLAQAIVAFFFLGGAVGKWTSGYWSGAVFDELFFSSNSRSFLPLLHGWLGDEGTHVAARWFSRMAVIIETLMAFIVLLPSQVAFVASLLAAAGLWLTASDLFEVCLPIVGIACAGRMLAGETTTTNTP